MMRCATPRLLACSALVLGALVAACSGADIVGGPVPWGGGGTAGASSGGSGANADGGQSAGGGGSGGAPSATCCPSTPGGDICSAGPSCCGSGAGGTGPGGTPTCTYSPDANGCPQVLKWNYWNDNAYAWFAVIPTGVCTTANLACTYANLEMTVDCTSNVTRVVCQDGTWQQAAYWVCQGCDASGQPILNCPQP